MIRTCPKCRGSGDVGVISNLRCDACSGEGDIDVITDADEQAYKELARRFGYVEVDDNLLGDDIDFDDGLDDAELDDWHADTGEWPDAED